MIPALATNELETLLAEAALLTATRDATRAHNAAFGATPNLSAYKSWSVQYLCELLQLPAMQGPAFDSDIRLRIALHLAPPQAISYDPKLATSRRELVYNYLEQSFSFDVAARERLARYVAVVLDSWDASRVRGLSSHRHRLLANQRYRCNACHVLLDSAERVKREEESALNGSDDPYKPYFDGDGVSEGLRPVVDHKQAVSKEGTNSLENLQVLCDLCNTGKLDGGGIRASQELEHSHKNILEIPRSHRTRMFYYRIQMDAFMCSACRSDSKELTVRKVRMAGAYVLTNLRTICYDCALADSL